MSLTACVDVMKEAVDLVFLEPLDFDDAFLGLLRAIISKLHCSMYKLALTLNFPVNAFLNHSLRTQRMALCTFQVRLPQRTWVSDNVPLSSSLQWTEVSKKSLRDS